MKFRDIFGAEEAGIRRYSNDDKPKRAEIAPFERVRITLVTLKGEGLKYNRPHPDHIFAREVLDDPHRAFHMRGGGGDVVIPLFEEAQDTLYMEVI